MRRSLLGINVVSISQDWTWDTGSLVPDTGKRPHSQEDMPLIVEKHGGNLQN